MSKRGQTLRALVNERLTAAAEEIFALFERTIAEFEAELCRSKEINQKKQELLNSLLLTHPGPGLNQGLKQGLDQDLNQGLNPETSQIKEEQIVKEEEEEELPVQIHAAVQHFSAVCVKTEESSLLQRTQREHRRAASRLHTATDEDTEHSSDNDDWRAPFSCSAAQMETETYEDHYKQLQIEARSTNAQNSSLFPQYESVPETSAAVSSDMSGTAAGGEKKKHHCPMCQKGFENMHKLHTHFRVHTGEKPFTCPTCNKTFTQKSNLEQHVKLHTGEKIFSCTICKKIFSKKCTLEMHLRTHTGERPFSCSLCEKAFSKKCSRDAHVRTHTGERPYSCSMCEKTFSYKNNLVTHERTHTGERPYSCPVCDERFTHGNQLKRHMKTHSTEGD